VRNTSNSEFNRPGVFLAAAAQSNAAPVGGDMGSLLGFPMSTPASAPLIRWNGKEHPLFNRELLPYGRQSKEIFQRLRVSSVPAGKNSPKFLNSELLEKHRPCRVMRPAALRNPAVCGRNAAFYRPVESPPCAVRLTGGIAEKPGDPALELRGGQGIRGSAGRARLRPHTCPW
jgi:hypothetical protein